jgi:transcriptional regulator with XRE-family HTH domain
VKTRPASVKKHDWKLARHLQKIRQAKGITQEELAEHIGVSTPYIGRIEAGTITPNLKLLQKIARALGVKVKDLIPY